MFPISCIFWFWRGTDELCQNRKQLLTMMMGECVRDVVTYTIIAGYIGKLCRFYGLHNVISKAVMEILLQKKYISDFIDILALTRNWYEQCQNRT